MPRVSAALPKLPQLTPAGRGQLVAELFARRLVELVVPPAQAEGALTPKRGRSAAQEGRRGAR
jgi:hypothetical protein